MYATGGIAERFTDIWRRAETRLGLELPVAVRFWDGSEIASGSPGTVTDTLVFNDREALAYVLTRPGQLGLARAYVSGRLTLEGEVERVLKNGEMLADFGFEWRDLAELGRTAISLRTVRPPRPPASEARVAGRLHSRRRDRQAVTYHYDVSNDFYRLVLGPTMVYSCAYFKGPEDSLEEAQTRKLDVICRKLRLEPEHRFLDIGCGWGSLVMHAAANYGVRAVGITLSREQAEYAQARIRDAGLADRCEIRVQDYREITDGPYDRIASVGMFEHVGAAMLDRYMDTVTGLGRPGGLALHHGICRQHDRATSANTFIARYVFPDGELHRVGRVVAALERSRQELRDAESLREHYALTLRRWVANLKADPERAEREAGSERYRIWELYMTASALAFERGDISVHQLLAVLPDGAGSRSGRPPAGLDLARPGYAGSRVTPG